MSRQIQRLAVDGIHLGDPKAEVEAALGPSSREGRPYLTFHRGRTEVIFDGETLQVEGRESIRAGEPMRAVLAALGEPDEEFEPRTCLQSQWVKAVYRMPGGILAVTRTRESFPTTGASTITSFYLRKVATVSEVEVDGIALDVSRWKVDALYPPSRVDRPKVTFSERGRVEGVVGKRLTVPGRGQISVGDLKSKLYAALGEPEVGIDGTLLYNLETGKLWVELARETLPGTPAAIRSLRLEVFRLP